MQQTAQLQIFLNAIRRRIYDRLTTLLTEHNALKVKMVVSVDYQVPHKLDEPHRTLQLNTKFKTVYPASRLESVIHYFEMETLLRNALAILDRSGLTIFRINYVDLHTATHQPLAARCYKPLPHYLMTKKAIVNV